MRAAFGWLELRVPPVAVALVLLLVMKGLDMLEGGALAMPDLFRTMGALLIVAGALVAVAGAVAFQRHRTTVDPMHPERASTLVESGIFRFSRNPMYLGFVVMLAGAGLNMGSCSALLGPVALALWLHGFQIRPEERLLRERFGSAFDAYCRRVPRWLGRPGPRGA